ncbi:MAG: peptide chain release factor N(5)-glutamine methyltransferase [Archangium sp.]|nr:peptide chain release factor N(5)-glutamine methyltransferase [Archangium sp.]MDP3573683.1 peptide chain release factor N(5)-glutamine methyltransferase [Archangium sp.]
MSDQAWTIRKVLEWTRGHFDKQDIDDPRLTSEILLGHVLSLPRVKLYMDLDRPLSKDELATYRALIQRRLAFEPTQYLVGFKEFYGRRFTVDQRVLIPRSETELLVEAVLHDVKKDAPSRVLDVCTGSGCIAVTIAAERPQASVWATDLMPGAIAVAKSNAETHQVDGRVTFFQGDLLAAVPAGTRFDVIVSNPPYVKTGELATLQKEVRQEPREALDGGPEGVTLIARLVTDALPLLKPGGLLAMEIGEDEGTAVRELLTRAGYHDVKIEKDLARHERLALGRAPSKE